MVIVSYLEKNKIFNFIEVNGHALFSEKGKDIVCAGISSIIEGSFSFFKKFYEGKVDLTKKKNFVYFKINENFKTNFEIQVCFKMIVHQLKNIENFYPNYIKLVKLLKKK